MVHFLCREVHHGGKEARGSAPSKDVEFAGLRARRVGAPPARTVASTGTLSPWGVLAVYLFLLCRFASGEIRAVPLEGESFATGGHASLAAGLAAAGDGGVVTASGGIYSGTGNWSLRFSGQRLVCQEGHVCEIRCPGPGTSSLVGAFYTVSASAHTSAVHGFRVTGCTGTVFSSNPGFAFGGALVALYGDFELVDVVVSGTTANSGGVVYAQLAAVSLVNVSVVGAAAGVGGCAMVHAGSTLTVRGSRLELCHSLDDGGAIMAVGDVDMEDVDIVGGSAAQLGGGLYVGGTGTARLRNVTITDGISAYGSGVYLQDTATISASGLSVVGCQSSNDGAFAMYGNAVANVEFMTVRDCGTSGHGAGVFITDNSVARLNHTVIAHNSAPGYGGGMLVVSRAVAECRNCLLSRNDATGAGIAGAVYMQDSSQLTFVDSILRDNHAGSLGGAVYINGGASGSPILAFVNTSVLDNRAEQGGAMYTIGMSSISAEDSVIVGNSGSSFGGGFSIFGDTQLQMTRILVGWNSAGLSAAFLVAGESSTTTINGMVATGNVGYLGGVVGLSDDANCVISGLVARNNIATHSGGVISATASARIAIADSSMHNNSCAVNGGAIDIKSDAQLIVADTTICASFAAAGGSLSLDGRATATMSNVSVSRSSATVNGGAIFQIGNTRLILNGFNCTASHAATGGCLFMMENASLTASGCTIRDGHATDGAGVLLIDSSRAAFSASTFFRNAALRTGGGIYADGNVSVVLNDTQLRWNRANSDGGAVHLVSGGTLSLLQASCSNNAASVGGCIRAGDETVVDVRWTAIEGNIAISQGGGIYSTGALSIANSSLRFNAADSIGGAAMLRQAVSFTLQDSQCHNNTAFSGGCVYVSAATRLRFSSSSFVGNAAQADGGALNVQSQASVTDCSFVGNGGDRGAAAFVNNASVLIDGCTFEGGVAGVAGGIFGWYASLSVVASTVHSNEAGSSGGCIFGVGAIVDLNHSTFTENHAQLYGAAVYASLQGAVYAYSSVFSHNSANSAVLMIDDGHMVVHDSVFQHNWFTLHAALLLHQGTSEVLRCEFTGNSAGVSGGSIYVAGDEAYMSVEHCDFTGSVARFGRAADVMSESGHISMHNCTFSHSRSGAEGGSVAGLGGEFLASELHFHDTVSSSSGGAMYMERAVVTMHNVTVEFALSSRFGGAIFVSGGEWTATTVVVNEVVSSQGSGGMHLSGGSANLVDVGVSHSSGFDGAALSVSKATVVADGICCIECRSQRYGGMISITEGTVSMHNIFGSNSSAQSGGFVNVRDYAHVDISNVSFDGGYADDYGGFVHATSGSTTTFKHCKFSTALARDLGGGVEVNQFGTVVSLQNCELSHLSSTNGGGISLRSQGMVTISQSVISDVLAVRAGGIGIATSESVLDVHACSMHDSHGTFGGALNGQEGSVLSLRESWIRLSEALTGGALQITRGAKAEVGNVYVNECYAASFGGALYAADAGSHLTVNQSTLQLCESKNGGGIAVIGGAGGAVSGSSIRLNHASDGGGGVIVSDATSFTMEGCDVNSNSGFFSSGGMMVRSTLENSNVVNVLDSVFNSNLAGSGGALGVLDKGRVLLSNSSFVYNRATVVGGAIDTVSDGEVSVRTGFIAYNVAQHTGGGLSIRSSGCSCTDSTLLLNWASEGGGNLAVSSSGFALARVTVQEGRSPGIGGGLLIQTERDPVSVSVRQTAFRSNAAKIGGAIGLEGAAAAHLSVEYSSFTENGAVCRGAVLSCDGNAAISMDVATEHTLPSSQDGSVQISCSSSECSFVGSAGLEGACLARVATPVYAAPIGSRPAADDVTDECCGATDAPCIGIERALQERGRDGEIRLFPGVYNETVVVLNVGTLWVMPASTSQSALLTGTWLLKSGTLIVYALNSTSAFHADGASAILMLQDMMLLRTGENAYLLDIAQSKVYMHNSSVVDQGSGGDRPSCISLLNAELHMSRSTIAGCTSASHGGAIGAIASSVWVGTSSFVRCAATVGGAMSLSESFAVITNTTFEQCDALDFGGALAAVDASTLQLSRSTVKHCTANYGGGLSTRRSKATLSTVSVESCSATNDGGAIATVGSELNVSLSTVSECKADKGGVISHAGLAPTWLDRETPLAPCVTRINRTLIQDNRASVGGALSGTGDVYVTDSVVVRNKALGDGGAVHCNSPMLTSGTVWSENAAIAGGAYYLSGNCQLTMRDCTLQANSAELSGGAVNMNLGSHSLVLDGDIAFRDNRAGEAGGAVALLGSARATVKLHGRTLFDGNTCPGGIGGAVYLGKDANESIACELSEVIATANCATYGADGYAAGETECLRAQSDDSGAWVVGGPPAMLAPVDVMPSGATRELIGAVLVGDPVTGALRGKSTLNNVSTRSLHVALVDRMHVPTRPEPGTMPALLVVGTEGITVAGATRATFSPPVQREACVTDQSCCGDWYLQPAYVAMFSGLTVFGPPGGRGFIQITVDPEDLGIAPLLMHVHMAACPAGMDSSVTSASCTPCSPGYFRDGDADGDCARCASGAVSAAGAATCHACPVGTRAVGGISCEECPEDTVLQGDTCIPCDNPAVTCAGGVAMLQQNYWLPEGSSFQPGSAVYVCSPGHCVPGENGTTHCATHRTGPLCALCDDGRYDSGGQCALCPSPGLAVGLALLVGVAVCVALAIAIRRAATAWDRVHLATGVATPVMKTVASYLQVSGLLNTFQVPWPKTAAVIWDVGSSSSTIGAGGFLSCTIPGGVYGQFWFVVGAVCTAAATAFVVPLVAAKKRGVPLMSKVGLLVVLYMAYPSLALRAFALLRCSQSIDGASYVVEDFSKRCDTETHALHVAVATVLVLGLLLPFPLVCGFVLRRAYRSGKLHSRETTGSLLFLWDGYHSKNSYYESFVMLRKLCICAASAVLRGSDRFYQAWGGVVVLLASLVIQLVLRPFHDPRQALLDNLSLGATTVSLYVGQLYLHGLSESGEWFALAAIVIANAVFVGACIKLAVSGWRASLKAVAKPAEQPSAAHEQRVLSRGKSRLRSWAPGGGAADLPMRRPSTLPNSNQVVNPARRSVIGRGGRRVSGRGRGRGRRSWVPMQQRVGVPSSSALESKRAIDDAAERHRASRGASRLSTIPDTIVEDSSADEGVEMTATSVGNPMYRGN